MSMCLRKPAGTMKFKEIRCSMKMKVLICKKKGIC